MKLTVACAALALVLGSGVSFAQTTGSGSSAGGTATSPQSLDQGGSAASGTGSGADERTKVQGNVPAITKKVPSTPEQAGPNPGVPGGRTTTPDVQTPSPR